MANQPKTRARGIRIPDDMWAALVRVASAQARSVSEVVRDSVRDYLTKHETESHDG